MSRLCLGRSRAAATPVLFALVLVLLPDPAVAQTSTAEPRITSASGRVSYGGDATIRGRLDGGTVGQELHLERRAPGRQWRTIGTRAVDERGRVRFRVRDLHFSAAYRLLYIDEMTEEESRSARIRISVTARLQVRTSKDHLMQGRRLRVSGSLFPKVPGRTVLLQQKVAGEWRYIDRLSAGDGFFSRYFKPSSVGYRRLRVKFAGDARNRAARDRTAIRVYDPDLATWYGPGLYGNRTACGQTLGTNTLGVAHRSLPCGTKVSILYEGRTITVPVIDRGPYTHAEWDLTAETAERLGFSGTDTIGTDN
ncbi:MAG: septal ring lytic transglycosylase RlpA family protein [Actinomycetota bacterium]|nr:septal ring lytic transglycosylase RlpA family protein [Actinomycetota bacterium]